MPKHYDSNGSGSSSHNSGNTTMSDPITSTTAADGTELQLRERDDGLYEIRDSTGAIIEEPSATDEEGARAALAQTREHIGVGMEAEQSRQSRRSRSSALGGGWDSPSRDTDSGGLFGGGMSDDGGLFGGGGGRERERRSDDADSGGGLLGGGGGFFGGGGGGGGSARRERDAETGRFAPTRREQPGFEMERDSQGRFTGRADDDQDSSGGFISNLFR